MTRQARSKEFYSSHSLYDSLQLHLLDDFEILGDPINWIAVRTDSDPELKRYITAAAKAYHMGLRSIDRVLKEYGENWLFKDDVDEERKLCRDILWDVKRHISRTIEWMFSIKDKPQRGGLLSAECALIRLEGSFVAAGFLIKRGYIFEALGVCRLILEQIAWAYYVHGMKNEKIFNDPPRNEKLITNLKAILPEVGRYYGRLSEQAHVSPKLIHTYLALDKDGPKVLLASSEGSAERALELLKLADYFTVVSEYIYRELPCTFSCLKKDRGGRFSVRKSRPLLKLMERYRKKISY